MDQIKGFKNKMKNYIEITASMTELVGQLNFNLSEIEVKGESVKFLFNARMIVKQILENVISEEEILNKNKKEDSA